MVSQVSTNPQISNLIQSSIEEISKEIKQQGITRLSKKSKTPDFKKGEQILLKNLRRNNKLQPFWEGEPVTIVKVCNAILQVGKKQQRICRTQDTCQNVPPARH